MCPWQCFRKRLSFQSVDTVKKMDPHQYGWASSNPLTAWIEQNGRRRVNSLSLPELRCPSSLLGEYFYEGELLIWLLNMRWNLTWGQYRGLHTRISKKIQVTEDLLGNTNLGLTNKEWCLNSRLGGNFKGHLCNTNVWVSSF